MITLSASFFFSSPFSTYFTPITELFFTIKSLTSAFVIIFTFNFFNFLYNASITLPALSVIGNTLLPLSTFVSSPSSLRILIISLFVNFSKLLYKNLPFPGMFSMNSDISISFVILHLPFPVILSFFPYATHFF